MQEVEEQLMPLLEGLEVRLAQTAHTTESKLGGRGLRLSGIAVVEIIKETMSSLESELVEILETMSARRPTREEWQRIRQQTLSFVDRKADWVLRQANKPWAGGSDHEAIYKESRRVVDTCSGRIKAATSAYVTGQERLICERRRSLWMDILKHAALIAFGCLLTYLLMR